jgi:hypothetical protein
VRFWVSLPRREVEHILQEGLHEFITRFINHNAALGQDVADAYLSGQ